MTATSRAVEYISLSNSPTSRPWGFENSVLVMPSSAALAFMAATKASLGSCPSAARVAPTVSAMAMAASLPEGTMRPVSAACSDSLSPTASSADDSPTVPAASLTVTVVSRGIPESRATMAVITLVMEAMWVCVSASREKYTVPSAPTTMAYFAVTFGQATAGSPRSATVVPSSWSVPRTSARAGAGAKIPPARTAASKQASARLVRQARRLRD